jgi:hypothetical protein
MANAGLELASNLLVSHRGGPLRDLIETIVCFAKVFLRQRAANFIKQGTECLSSLSEASLQGLATHAQLAGDVLSLYAGLCRRNIRYKSSQMQPRGRHEFIRDSSSSSTAFQRSSRGQEKCRSYQSNPLPPAARAPNFPYWISSWPRRSHSSLWPMLPFIIRTSDHKARPL